MNFSTNTFLFFLLLRSHAVWAAADPPGHHPADDEQHAEGQQHSAHTGRKAMTAKLKYCINLTRSEIYPVRMEWGNI